MPSHLLAVASPVALSTSGLVTYLQGLFGPLFLGIVGIVAIFFLFTREIIGSSSSWSSRWLSPSSSTRRASCRRSPPESRTRWASTDIRGAEGEKLVDLPTYTNIWRIEKRLYKLYDFRLPMPLPIGQIAVFAAIAVPYIVLLTILGLPFSHTLLWLYVLPPGRARPGSSPVLCWRARGCPS